ncbi:MAG: hypothetical protein JO038_04555 [Alphaproteobacteria bacterium]|nr:hypothetical protein [Alphaproteobacteria bacterium]
MSSQSDFDASQQRAPSAREKSALFRRSIFGLVFGTNVGAIIALVLVGTLCYLLIVRERYDLQGSFMNAILLLLATISMMRGVTNEAAVVGHKRSGFCDMEVSLLPCATATRRESRARSRALFHDTARG